MDASLEMKISQWKLAKQQKDFATADQLRDELRAAGLDPDRPKDQVRNDPDIQNKLQQWQEAKQNKDFGTADMIRAELRGQGVECDPVHGGGQSPFADGQFAFQSRGQQQQQQFGGQQSGFAAAAGQMRQQSGFGGAPGGMQGGQAPAWMNAYKAVQNQGQQQQVGGQQQFNKPMPNANQMDAETTEQLTQWFAARQEQNFALSDMIRESLRAKGIEPSDCQKPRPGGFQQQSPQSGGFQQQSPQLDGPMQEELRQWFEAREQKAWGIADEIRERLRAQGVEPSECQRPGPATGGFGKAGGKGFGGGARSNPYGH